MSRGAPPAVLGLPAPGGAQQRRLGTAPASLPFALLAERKPQLVGPMSRFNLPRRLSIF